MLSSLTISNIALISKLEVQFDKQLNVLSGETGAGKSIIVDSLAFVLGERADKSLIKNGEECAFVEACFTANEAVQDVLVNLGFEKDNNVIISRTLSLSGRNDCKVNGRNCSASMLKQITAKLVDIFGQSQHLGLFRRDTHIDIVDAYYSDASLFEKLSDLVHQIRSIDKQLKSFGGSDEQRERQLDILKYQIDEISKAELSVDEENNLNIERIKAINSEKLISAVDNAVSSMFENNDCINSLTIAHSSLSQSSLLDSNLSSINDKINDIKFELMDISALLNEYRVSCDYDADKAEKIEERLSTIKNVCRKYGSSIPNALQFLEDAQNEYSRLLNAADTISQLNSKRQQLFEQSYNIATQISLVRRKSATMLTQAILNELASLGMKGAMFEVGITSMTKDEYNAALSTKGIDKVEFLLSANVGEPLKPLVKVISGGEMSRFMLAIKNITATIEKIPTMVFDEIDNGISGNIASMVAIKLASVSKQYQCIVITHLPQIASMGDCNFVISKAVDNGRTISSIHRLNINEKIQEVARLSGGQGQASLMHADELIKWANGQKSQIKQ